MIARAGWDLAREVVITGLPGLAVVLILYIVDILDVSEALLGGALVLLFSVPLALISADDLKNLGAWLESLSKGSTTSPPPALRFAAIEFVARPAQVLSRTIQNVERLNANRQMMIDQIVDTLPDPIMLVDNEIKIIRANAAASEHFSDFTDVTDKISLTRLIRDPDLLAAVETAIESNIPTSLTYRPNTERQEEYFARIEPIMLPEGNYGALIAMREQTEQLMIERIRSDFVANASHEIKTPLASLQGFIETLQGPARDDPEAVRSFLDTMAQETDRLTRLVNDLLSLSHIELSASQLPDEPCDLAFILQRVTNRLEPIAKSYGVSLDRTAPTDLPTIRGDEDQIHQLLINLVDNAIKYGGRGKRVTIETAVVAEAPAQTGSLANDPAVVISVMDEGQGIEADQLPRLTERFYRADKARSRQVGGTGLGLAIVKHIVRRHRGFLEIKSEIGVGSSFRVFLPIQKMQQSAIE